MNEDIRRLHSNRRMSKAVQHAGLLFLCGQTAFGSPHAEADIAAQTHEVLARIDTLLNEANTDRTRLLAVTIHLRDLDDFAGMNAVWEAWLMGGPAPARTTVEARLASPGLRVEMTVVAAAGRAQGIGS